MALIRADKTGDTCWRLRTYPEDLSNQLIDKQRFTYPAGSKALREHGETLRADTGVSAQTDQGTAANQLLAELGE